MGIPPNNQRKLKLTASKNKTPETVPIMKNLYRNRMILLYFPCSVSSIVNGYFGLMLLKAHLPQVLMDLADKFE